MTSAQGRTDDRDGRRVAVDGNASSFPGDIGLSMVPSSALGILLGIIAVLVVLSMAGQLSLYYLPDFVLRDWLANFFDVNMEQNLPTMYSLLSLLVCASLFGLIAHAHRRVGRPYVRHWAFLAFVFVLLALDDFVAVHEQSSVKIRDLLHIRGGLFEFAWVIPAAVAVVLLGIAYLPFLRHLPRPTRRRLWAAGSLFMTGTIGLEMVGASYSSVHGRSNMVYELIVTVEETLEMVGVAVLIYALLVYIATELPHTSWRLRVATKD